MQSTREQTRGRPQQRPLTIERKGERAPYKPKPWSHQNELQAARGKPINLHFLDGSKGAFVLVEADAFALRVCAPGSQSALTYWKHALLGYRLEG